MSSYLGNFASGAMVALKFTTMSAAPATLTGGALAVYKNGSTAQSTSGVTLTADFDGLTGLNQADIDTSSDPTFYSDGGDFQVVLTAGTVDGESVVGVIVGSFSIQARFNELSDAGIASAADFGDAVWNADVSMSTAPGTMAAQLDVATSTRASSAQATAIEADTQDLQARVPAALVGGRIDANVGAVSGDATAADNLEAAADGTGYNLGGGQVVAASVTGAVGSVTAGVTLAAAAVAAIWDRLTSALTTVGSIGKLISDQLDATMSSRAAQASADAIEADTQDIQSRLPAALVAGRMASDAVAVAGSTAAANAVQANIGNLDAAISSRSTLTAAQANAEADQALADAGVTPAAMGRMDVAVSTRASAATAAAIQAKTDNLPVDPADASDIAARFTTLDAAIAAVSTLATAIKAKSDNLPNDPADASVVAGDIATLASTLATILAAVDTEVAAIKAKTDQLTFSVPTKVDATASVDSAAIAAQVAEALQDTDLAVVTHGPVLESGNLEIVRGDTYTVENGNPLRQSHPSLVGLAVVSAVWVFREGADGELVEHIGAWDADAGASTCDLLHEDTVAFGPGVRNVWVDVRLTLPGGHTRTPFTPRMTVREGLY